MKHTLLILFFSPSLVFASFPVLDKKIISYNVPCDNIILKNGQEISAKVVEITPDLVKYRKCSNIDGPLISIYKTEILMLRYSNGSKDIFPTSKGQFADNSKKNFAWGGIVSLILAHLALTTVLFFPTEVFAILFFALSAILFGASSFAKKWWGFGLAGTIIGGLVFFITTFSN